jgi:hypothetical protein
MAPLGTAGGQAGLEVSPIGLSPEPFIGRKLYFNIQLTVAKLVLTKLRFSSDHYHQQASSCFNTHLGPKEQKLEPKSTVLWAPPTTPQSPVLRTPQRGHQQMLRK